MGILLIIGILQVALAAAETNPYRHTVVLDKEGNFVVDWLADRSSEQIYFNVTVNTRGWVGLGLARDANSKHGADIVMGGVYPDGTAYFKDRYGVKDSVPLVDPSQDWNLISAWESGSTTFLSFSRPFETCDSEHDQRISDDALTLIWAYGETDDDTQYHYQYRGGYHVNLLDPDLTPRSLLELEYANITSPTHLTELGDWKVWDVVATQLMPAKDTAYICSFHKAPRGQRKHHIIGVRPVFNSSLERQHVHHFDFYICRPPPGYDPREIFDRFVGQPGEECLGRGQPIPDRFCTEIIHEYTIGGRPFFLPGHVGLPFLESPDEYYLLQAHYDNPHSTPNINLRFSLEIFYTDQLRQYDAGVMFVGTATPGATSILVPPSEPGHVHYSHCASGCTEKMLPPSGINVFAAQLHTHLAGHGARLVHIKEGEEHPILIDDNFNFNFQNVRVFPRQVNVLPGEMIVQSCLFRTPNREYVTVGGYTTRNEMCLSFLWFYPRLRPEQVPSCASEIRSSDYSDFLQIYNTTWSAERTESVVTAPEASQGRSVANVAADINWNIANREKLQNYQRFLPQVSMCPSFDTESNNLIPDRSLGFFAPRNEFISEWPPNLKSYVRESRCSK